MVAERGVWPPQERTTERTCEQVVDVRMPQVVGQVLEVLEISRQDRDMHGTVEQIPDILVPEMVEQLVKLPETVSDDRIQQRTAEHIAVIPVPQDVKELVEVSEVFPQDRSQQCFLEQINETPDVSLAEKVFERPVTHTQQGVNTHAQHIVNTVEVERPKIIDETVQRTIIQDKINQVTQHFEVPLSQFNDKVVDNPVVAQRQIYMVLTVQKSIEIPQLQVTDQVNDVPVVLVAQVPRVFVVEKTTEIPQFWAAKLLKFKTSKLGDEQISFKEYVNRMKEGQNDISPITDESIAAVSSSSFRENLRRKGYEVLYVADPVDEFAVQQPKECDGTKLKSTMEEDLEADIAKCTGAAASTRQQHKQRATTQTAQEERERGRKGQWGRDQEGRKKEEREAEEGGSELVEKDVTGWTEVTRNKRKKVVQIFVKVDGMKTVVMEVSPEDKVQKILNTVSGSERDVYVTSGGRILRGSDKLKSCEVRDGSTVEVTSRMRGGGKHKDKKGKEEKKKKQVAQLDDGMCAMACEQMRQVMENLKTVADNSTGEDKRRVVENVEELRKAIIGLRKQARGEELQRVAELEESLKKLEEEMLLWSVEEQEQRRQEEQEHAAMRKGKGKGNGGKGEHASRKGKFGGKGAVKMVNGDDEGEEADEEMGGTRNLRWADCEEEEGERQGAAEGEWHKSRKEQGIMWLDGSDEEREGHGGSTGGERCEVCGRVEVWSEESEEQEERGGQGGEGARQKMPSEEDEEDERTVVAPNTGAGGSHPRATTDPEEEVKEEELTGEEKADEKPPGLEVVKSKQEEQEEQERSQVKSECEVQEEEEQEEVKSEQEVRKDEKRREQEAREDARAHEAQEGEESARVSRRGEESA